MVGEIQRLKKSIVKIRVDLNTLDEAALEYLRVHNEDPWRNVAGSGVIFCESERHFYVFSAFHVTNPGKLPRSRVNPQARIVLAGGLQVRAKVRVEDFARDLSILRISKGDVPEGMVQPVPLGNQSILEEALHRRVVILGYSSKETTCKSRYGRVIGRQDVRNDLIIDVAIPVGFSGGPVLYDNRIIGVIAELSDPGHSRACCIRTILKRLAGIVDGTINFHDNLSDESDRLAFAEALRVAALTDV